MAIIRDGQQTEIHRSDYYREVQQIGNGLISPVKKMLQTQQVSSIKITDLFLFPQIPQQSIVASLGMSKVELSCCSLYWCCTAQRPYASTHSILGGTVEASAYCFFYSPFSAVLLQNVPFCTSIACTTQYQYVCACVMVYGACLLYTSPSPRDS